MYELLASGSLFLLLDRCSKIWVQRRVPERVFFGGRFLQIRCVAHCELLYERAGARAALVLIWVLAMASAVWLHSSGTWLQNTSALVGVGCALGGAAGNLTDIFRRHHIVNFIDLGWWPVFNLADVGIVGGLLLAFWR